MVQRLSSFPDSVVVIISLRRRIDTRSRALVESPLIEFLQKRPQGRNAREGLMSAFRPNWFGGGFYGVRVHASGPGRRHCSRCPIAASRAQDDLHPGDSSRLKTSGCRPIHQAVRQSLDTLTSAAIPFDRNLRKRNGPWRILPRLDSGRKNPD